MEPFQWLALGYQVPMEPSKNRVYVWRKLKEFGAVYFRQGVALLPESKQSFTCFRGLSKKINDMGGDASLARLAFVDARDEKGTIAAFTNRSQQEYKDLLSDLAELRRQGDPVSATVHSEQTRRMARRIGQIKARDYFMSHRLPEISRGLADLLGDMSRATDDLSKHISNLLLDK